MPYATLRLKQTKNAPIMLKMNKKSGYLSTFPALIYGRKQKISEFIYTVRICPYSIEMINNRRCSLGKKTIKDAKYEEERLA